MTKAQTTPIQEAMLLWSFVTSIVIASTLVGPVAALSLRPAPTRVTPTASTASQPLGIKHNFISIPEHQWRAQAQSHRERIRDILQPGLTDPDDVINSGRHRRRRHNNNDNQTNTQKGDGWTALDPKHPIFNFLIEYYGLRGSKGPRRLARWFPDPALMLLSDANSAATPVADGILLEGATEDDWGSGHLHLRGAQLHPRGIGIVYSPSLYFGESSSMDTVTPYLWYQSILQQTLRADPVLHCYGLHEWAMQYYPEGAAPPPSAKYQSHLPLRVSQPVINETVERKGIRCTHVDALRYFAPAAGPFNSHGAQLERLDQLRLEQPACVHAHMDLIKLALRLQPFCNPTLVQDALEIAIRGRRLDVAGSPYDATSYGILAIPIETSAGRTEFQRQQVDLMEAAEPVRRRLLQAYTVFLQVAFDEQLLREARLYPAAERFARAEPGGMPWRKNLVEHEATSS
jgi:hypothetical protein